MNLGVTKNKQNIIFSFLSFLLQLDAQQSSSSCRLIKLSLTLVAGGAAVYYIHVRNPATIPTFLSKLRLQTVWTDSQAEAQVQCFIFYLCPYLVFLDNLGNMSFQQIKDRSLSVTLADIYYSSVTSFTVICWWHCCIEILGGPVFDIVWHYTVDTPMTYCMLFTKLQRFVLLSVNGIHTVSEIILLKIMSTSFKIKNILLSK